MVDLIPFGVDPSGQARQAKSGDDLVDGSGGSLGGAAPGYELIASVQSASSGNLSLACPAGALGADGDHLLLVMDVIIATTNVGFYITLNGTNISAGNNFGPNNGINNTAHVYRTGASAQACFSMQQLSTSVLHHGGVATAHSNAGVLTFGTSIWSGVSTNLFIRSAKVFKVRI